MLISLFTVSGADTHTYTLFYRLIAGVFIVAILRPQDAGANTVINAALGYMPWLVSDLSTKYIELY